MSIKIKPNNKGRYNDHLKTQIFFIWFNAGKPEPTRLYNILCGKTDEIGNKLPAKSTLGSWIKEDFEERARVLDEQIIQELEERSIAEKVEMFQRHAEIGNFMQHSALEWLRDNADRLTVSSAIRLLVEGVRIEKESRGLPQALEKMMKMTDEDLLEEVQRLVSRSPLSIEPVTDG